MSASKRCVRGRAPTLFWGGAKADTPASDRKAPRTAIVENFIFIVIYVFNTSIDCQIELLLGLISCLMIMRRIESYVVRFVCKNNIFVELKYLTNTYANTQPTETEH